MNSALPLAQVTVGSRVGMFLLHHVERVLVYGADRDVVLTRFFHGADVRSTASADADQCDASLLFGAAQRVMAGKPMVEAAPRDAVVLRMTAGGRGAGAFIPASILDIDGAKKACLLAMTAGLEASGPDSPLEG